MVVLCEAGAARAPEVFGAHEIVERGRVLPGCQGAEHVDQGPLPFADDAKVDETGELLRMERDHVDAAREDGRARLHPLQIPEQGRPLRAMTVVDGRAVDVGGLREHVEEDVPVRL